LLTAVILLTVAPFAYVVMSSFISSADYYHYGITFPKQWSLSNYVLLFAGNSLVLNGYKISVFVTAMGTLIGVVVTAMLAYPLSRPQLPGRKVIFRVLFFTLFFGGGIIPTYLVVDSLGLLNTVWALIIPGALNTFYLVIMRNFFLAFPESLIESAAMDGANDIIILFRIVIPLSLPVVATIALFYAIDRWNSFFDAMLYVSDQSLQPLQMVLYSVINQATMPVDPTTAATLARQPPVAQIMTATAIVASVTPVLLIYPFLQRYFTKGVMLGSLKE
jgi:putative aldouronate transport system permease protein